MKDQTVEEAAASIESKWRSFLQWRRGQFAPRNRDKQVLQRTTERGRVETRELTHSVYARAGLANL